MVEVHVWCKAPSWRQQKMGAALKNAPSGCASATAESPQYYHGYSTVTCFWSSMLTNCLKPISCVFTMSAWQLLNWRWAATVRRCWRRFFFLFFWIVGGYFRSSPSMSVNVGRRSDAARLSVSLFASRSLFSFTFFWPALIHVQVTWQRPVSILAP